MLKAMRTIPGVVPPDALRKDWIKEVWDNAGAAATFTIAFRDAWGCEFLPRIVDDSVDGPTLVAAYLLDPFTFGANSAGNADFRNAGGPLRVHEIAMIEVIATTGAPIYRGAGATFVGGYGDFEYTVANDTQEPVLFREEIPVNPADYATYPVLVPGLLIGIGA